MVAQTTTTSNEASENKYITRVSLGASFDNNEQVIRNMLATSSQAEGDITDANISDMLNALPIKSKSAKKRDTWVGGNDAVNSYYQFNANDDIIHSINKTGTGDEQGMGRVYNETFDQTQQILNISFGVPDFTNAATFLAYAYDHELAHLQNTGDATSVIQNAANFLGKVLGTIIKLPVLPFTYAMDLIEKMSASPTKYYDFKPTMALYYKTVNVILATIAVNMNIAGMNDPSGNPDSVDGIPSLLRTHGLDILSILSRKASYDDSSELTRINPGGASKGPTETLFRMGDQTVTDYNDRSDGKTNQPRSYQMSYEQSMWSNFIGGGGLALTEAMRYVGFRVEKSTSSSESASNSTKEPDFLSQVNSAVSAGREANFTASSLAKTGIGKVVKSMIDIAGSAVEGFTDTLNITGGIEMLKGAGFLDVPELWSASNFTKSYSFDFQLRTPYGDPISIFYSLYIPLAMMLAGAFPRSVGQNAYTSPFIVRAYCQGMFAIPLGIIDSIHIKRGNAEYGWANASGAMLPTEIDVSFTIKDLSPVMHIAIADGGMKEWLNILGQNSSFQEYMLTLAGTDVAQRTLLIQLAKYRKDALLKIFSNNKYNAMMFGFSLGNTRLGRIITAMNPISKLPGARQKG